MPTRTSESESLSPAHRTVLSAIVCVAAVLPWFVTGDLDAAGALVIFGRWTPEVFFRNAAAGIVALFLLRAIWLGAPRRRLFEAVGLVVSVGFVLVVLEAPAALGLVNYQDILGLPEHKRLTRIKPWTNPSNLRDEVLIFRHRPHFSFEGETTGDLVQLFGIATDRRYPVDVRYDANGHRNASANARSDVVLIGDSFIEAALIPQDGLLSNRLAEITGLDVLNLGVSGYGPQQELEVLRRHGLDVGARDVFWFFFEGNDLIDTHRYGVFQRNPDGYMNPETFRERSLTNSLAMSLSYWTEPTRREDATPARERSCTYAAAKSPEHRKLYFAYSGRPLGEEEAGRIEAFGEIIAEADALANERGARLHLVFVPTKFRVFAGLCEPPPDGRLREWVVNELPARMARLAEERNVAFIDLTGGLRAAARDGRSAYFSDDGHWDANGQTLVAELLAEALASDGPS